MRRLNQRRISVELCDIARRIIRQLRIKCDTSNQISLDVAFSSNKIGRIKCDGTSKSKPGLRHVLLQTISN